MMISSRYLVVEGDLFCIPSHFVGECLIHWFVRKKNLEKLFGLHRCLKYQHSCPYNVIAYYLSLHVYKTGHSHVAKGTNLHWHWHTKFEMLFDQQKPANWQT